MYMWFFFFVFYFRVFCIYFYFSHFCFLLKENLDTDQLVENLCLFIIFIFAVCVSVYCIYLFYIFVFVIYLMLVVLCFWARMRKASTLDKRDACGIVNCQCTKGSILSYSICRLFNFSITSAIKFITHE